MTLRPRRPLARLGERQPQLINLNAPNRIDRFQRLERYIQHQTRQRNAQPRNLRPVRLRSREPRGGDGRIDAVDVVREERADLREVLRAVLRKEGAGEGDGVVPWADDGVDAGAFAEVYALVRQPEIYRAEVQQERTVACVSVRALEHKTREVPAPGVVQLRFGYEIDAARGVIARQLQVLQYHIVLETVDRWKNALIFILVF